MHWKRFVMILTLTTMTMISASAVERVSAPDAGLFGRPTSVETVTVIGVPLSGNSNIDRSKDSVMAPPPFGGGAVSNASTEAFDEMNLAGDDTGHRQAPAFTPPEGLLDADGRLGTLSIPRLGLAVPVYHGEALDNLAMGAGHFESTSCWDGNVGFAAHNRGITGYFGEIHLLVPGDTIRYTTRLGTREYAVYAVEAIEETDFSRLGYAGDNVVTLITCVRDIPELRWCVQAREIS